MLCLMFYSHVHLIRKLFILCHSIDIYRHIYDNLFDIQLQCVQPTMIFYYTCVAVCKNYCSSVIILAIAVVYINYSTVDPYVI